MTVRAASSQEPNHSRTRAILTPLTTRDEWLVRPRRKANGERAVSADRGRTSVVASSDTGGSSRTGDLDLFAQAVPDALVDLDELGGQPDLLDVAGPRQVDADDVLDGGRPGGHHDDPGGEAGGFGQVVGDEDDGGSRARPELEELVLHQLSGLHVERAERLVEQQQ